MPVFFQKNFVPEMKVICYMYYIYVINFVIVTLQHLLFTGTLIARQQLLISLKFLLPMERTNHMAAVLGVSVCKQNPRTDSIILQRECQVFVIETEPINVRVDQVRHNLTLYTCPSHIRRRRPQSLFTFCLADRQFNKDRSFEQLKADTINIQLQNKNYAVT